MTASLEPAADAGTRALQRRTVRTLVGSQVVGGIGVSSGAAVGSLLAEQLHGSADLAGLGGTFQVVGGAVIAIPMARLMAARGRRPGLLLGYAAALVGAVGIITSAVVGSFPLFLVASILFGGATATNSQARYAAVDLAAPARRGRDLGIVVWATTIGAVLGPNLAGPGEPVARALGVDVLVGPYVFSLGGFVVAAVLIAVFLRPDPLLRAREVHAASGQEPLASHGSVTRGLRVAAGIRPVLLGVVTTALGHTVMVSVMVMTPLHMHHGGADLRIIGLVISLHVLGMFAFSPVVGWVVDRVGAHAVVVTGAVVLVGAGVLSATAPAGESGRLTAGLFLLGLGWSCTLISGSALVAQHTPVAERPGVQGAGDLLMGLAAGGGGALAGVVVGQLGYNELGVGAAVLAAVIGGLALGPLRTSAR